MICLEGTTEIQGHSQVGGLGNGCRPRTPSRTTDANLDCAFVENALLFVVLKFGRALAPCRPPLIILKRIEEKMGWGGGYFVGAPLA